MRAGQSRRVGKDVLAHNPKVDTAFGGAEPTSGRQRIALRACVFHLNLELRASSSFSIQLMHATALAAQRFSRAQHIAYGMVE